MLDQIIDVVMILHPYLNTFAKLPINTVNVTMIQNVSLFIMFF